jgi:RNA polymerase sigma-70 factor (ECF subfamily)
MSREDPPVSSSVADMAALGKLFEEHRPKLLAMVERRIDPALSVRLDAEDILEEAFLQARRKWERFKEQSAMTSYAWLYRIVFDCLIDAWRRQKRGPRDLGRDLPWPEHSSIQLGLGLVSPGTGPASATARADLCQRVRQAVEMLKPADREILWMRHNDELSFAEAAQVLEITENAATVRYVRALRRLKNLWHQLHPDDEEGS